MRQLLVIALIMGTAHAYGEASAAPIAPPCTLATDACSEWVELASPARAKVYRTYPLNVRNAALHRALIMVHGALRNADHYFSTATGAAFLAGVLSDTIVIAPAFRSSDGHCQDKLEPNEVNWSCSGDSWRSGGAAIGNPGLTSFGFVDSLLRQLADKQVFPNLTTIVVAGHSAGVQFVTRYEMANRVHEELGTAVAYAVANPSSYAWPDATRVLARGDASPENALAAWKDETPHTNFSYGPFDKAKAQAYNRWPLGLENRVGGYTANMSDEVLKKQLVSRPTTYLLSQVDTLPLGGFDDSPEAMAQGATRRTRGEAFVNYINQKLGAGSKVLIVPECGHNDRCVFTTDAVLAVIFPKPVP